MIRKFRVNVNGKPFDVEVEELNGSSASECAAAKKELPPLPPVLPVRPRAIIGHALLGNVVSPIPGRVLKVAVEMGRAVARGELLMIIESMKIENPIFAPKDGHIKDIKVASGEQVKIGDLLVVVA